MSRNKRNFSPTSDYPECSDCPVRATEECPAFYRIAEHCPHYERIIIRKEFEMSKKEDWWCPCCGEEMECLVNESGDEYYECTYCEYKEEF